MVKVSEAYVDAGDNKLLGFLGYTHGKVHEVREEVRSHRASIEVHGREIARQGERAQYTIPTLVYLEECVQNICGPNRGAAGPKDHDYRTPRGRKGEKGAAERTAEDATGTFTDFIEGRTRQAALPEEETAKPSEGRRTKVPLPTGEREPCEPEYEGPGRRGAYPCGSPCRPMPCDDPCGARGFRPDPEYVSYMNSLDLWAAQLGIHNLTPFEKFAGANVGLYCMTPARAGAEAIKTMDHIAVASNMRGLNDAVSAALGWNREITIQPAREAPEERTRGENPDEKIAREFHEALERGEVVVSVPETEEKKTNWWKTTKKVGKNAGGGAAVAGAAVGGVVGGLVVGVYHGVVESARYITDIVREQREEYKADKQLAQAEAEAKRQEAYNNISERIREPSARRARMDVPMEREQAVIDRATDELQRLGTPYTFTETPAIKRRGMSGWFGRRPTIETLPAPEPAPIAPPYEPSPALWTPEQEKRHDGVVAGLSGKIPEALEEAQTKTTCPNCGAEDYSGTQCQHCSWAEPAIYKRDM